MFRNLIFIAIIFISEISISFSQETTDFSEYYLTDMISDNSGNLFLSTAYGGIFISTDSGSSWELTSKITKDYNVASMIFNEYKGIFATTLEGVFLQSSNRGLSWRIRTGYDYKGFGQLGKLTFTNNYYKMFSRFSSSCYSFDNHHRTGGGFKVSDYHKSDDGTIYAAGELIRRYDKDNDALHQDWQDIGNGIEFTYCITSNKNNRLYIGTDNGILYSDNEGEEWNNLSEDIANNKITKILSQNNNTILVVSDSNDLMISTNNGVDFVKADYPDINSNVNCFFSLNDTSAFILTRSDGLLKSINNGKNIYKTSYYIDTNADSVFAEGWMPSINFYDTFPNMSSIGYVDFFHNDSLIFIASTYQQIYDANTGKKLDKYSIPDSIEHSLIKFVNADSVLIVHKGDSKYFFSWLNLSNHDIDSFFSIDTAYFLEIFIYKNYEYYWGPKFETIDIDSKTGTIFIKYRIEAGVRNSKFLIEKISDDRYEKWDMVSKEKISDYNYNSIFSKDLDYYLVEGKELFDIYDNLIFNIREVQENKSFLKDAPSYLSARISANNKHIVFCDYKNDQFFIADFHTGITPVRLKYEKGYSNSISY